MADWLIETERTITQSEIGRFAELSGDRNPVHLDPGVAAEGPFGRTIAHGALVTSLVHGLIAGRFPKAMVVNEDVRFLAPTFPGEPLVFRVGLVDASREQTSLHYEVSRVADGTVTCKGECTVRP